MYQTQPGGACQSRRVVLARQLVADSAHAIVHHPLRCGCELGREAADHARALAVGGLGKRLVALQGPPPPLARTGETFDLSALDKDLQELTGRDLEPADIGLFIGGDESLAVLEEMIEQATTQIDVIMFYWDNDEVGRALAAKLASRAGPNLPVRILIDGGGNEFFGEPEKASASQVNEAVAVLARHPFVQVVRIRNPFGRYDHRKLVLIDGRWAWTGGRNFARPAFRGQHDLSFSIAGPLTTQLQRCFEEDWQRQAGHTPAGGHRRPATPGPHTLPADYSASAGPSRIPAASLPCQARLLHSAPGKRELAHAVYEAIDRARDRIYLENVYLSDSLLIYKLAQARQRGVDVRVALTLTSGSPTVDGSNRVVANRLLRAGVRVFINPGMTHVKALCVDGCWAYLGTGNFDALSLRHNYEVGLAVSGFSVVRELEQRLFQPDFAPLWEMSKPVPLRPRDRLSEVLASLWL